MKGNNKLKVLTRSFLSIVLGASCLVGCTDGKNGTDGVAGTNGSTWFSGVETPSSSLGNIGDFYFETDAGDVWQKGEAGWTVISNIKGPQGDQGPVGKPAVNIEYRNNGTHIQWKYVNDNTWTNLVALEDITGPDGKDGTDVYVGYDGYVWIGENKTALKITDLDEDIVETTMLLKDSVYFSESVISAGTKVALMANYKSTIKMTQYSNSKVSEIATFVSEAGTLDIGVVDLTTGVYTLKETKTVTEGKNIINVNITVGEHETLVLGGETTTVGLYKSTGVISSDEFGLFTSDLDEFGISKTGTVNDKLIVSVKAIYSKVSSSAVFPTVTTVATNSDISSLNTVVDTAAPFAYKDYSLFAGKTITKIGIPVKAILDADDAFVTVYVIKTSILNDFENNYVRKVKVSLPAGATANTWVYADCNIELADDEYFAIGASTGDTVDWGYRIANTYTEYQFWQNKAGQSTSKGNEGGSNLLFDIYVEDTIKSSLEDHLEELERLEAEANQ